VLAASFAGMLVASLHWKMQHDAPIMIYIAYLIDRLGRIPYVEIFDMNLPGTYAVHVLLGRVFGYGDLGFRLADLAWLLAIQGVSFAALRSVSRRAAVGAALLFGLAYLGFGPRRSLQREFLLLLPLAGALWAAARPAGLALRWRAVLIGLFCGAAATIKPHAAMGLPVFLWFAHRAEGERTEGRGPALLGAAAGFLMPVCAVLVYLQAVGALAPFWDAAAGYWPLYAEIGQNLSIVSGPERLPYLLKGWLRFGAGHYADTPAAVWREGRVVWFPAAAVGFAMSQRGGDATQARVGRLLGALALVFSVYPVLTGKFWGYHWLPFLYFVCGLAGLCLAPRPTRSPAPESGRRRLASGAALAVLAVTTLTVLDLTAPLRLLAEGRGDSVALNPRKRRPQEIGAFLRAHLEPGDTVQPLDWTGGAIHGMLLSRAELATSFVYDFHFYHHVDSAYIRVLRARFAREFEASQPRYVIEILGLKPVVKTEAARSLFPALQAFLDAAYTPVHRGPGFVIYERRNNADLSP
jgi:hypothetical protein